MKYGSSFNCLCSKVTEEQLAELKALPEEFDWRNVGGRDYVSPVRYQGTCGSCFAFSTLSMFEARVCILSNGTKTPVFSTQDIVSCSEYSQGCEGGIHNYSDVDEDLGNGKTSHGQMHVFAFYFTYFFKDHLVNVWTF